MFITDETVLSEFFTYECIAGSLIKDDKYLFDRLCGIFLLPKTEREKLYALTCRPAVRSVESKNDYMRYLRTRKYAQMVGIEDDVTEQEHAAITVKGAALTAAFDLGLCKNVKTTENAVYRLIDECALSGSLIALRLIGFLQCEGLFAEKDLKAGLHNISKAARWNCAEAALMSLYYDKAERQKTMESFSEFARGTAFEAVVKQAANKYGVAAAETSEESKLLKKVFGTGILNPNTYSAQHAKIIFGKTIPLRDKERLLLSSNRDLFCETVDLPLKMTFRPITFDKKVFDGKFSEREDECDAVLRAAENFDLRALQSYRPLCVCSDSDYVLDMYMQAVKSALRDCRVERIDVADLCEYDFEPTGSNVFVRSCDEDKNNACFLVFEGDCDERTTEHVINFLQSGKRAKTRLVRPKTVLDLSAVLPICFCDSKNVKNLKKYCDTVELSAPSAREKYAAANDLLAVKSALYGVGVITLDDSGKNSLASVEMDAVERVLDRAVRVNGKKGKPLVLTEKLLRRHIEDTKDGRIRCGFGGENQ